MATIEVRAESSQVRTATQELEGLRASATTAAGSVQNLDAATRRGGENASTYGRGVRRATQDLDQFNKKTADTSRKIGQVGVQFEQLIGQIANGGNVTQALAFQLADIGIVLGLGLAGAVAGITASFVGMALAAGDTSNSLDKLDEIADKVGETFTTAADGTDIFTDSIVRLAERSEALARVQIAQTIARLEDSLATGAQGIRNAIDDFAGVGLRDFNRIALESGLTMEELVAEAERLSDVVVSNLNGNELVSFADRVGTLSRRFGITTEQAIDLGVAISDFINDRGPVGIARLRGAIEDLSDETGQSNEKVRDFSSTLLPFFESTRVGVDRLGDLRQALADIGVVLEGGADSTTDASNRANRFIDQLNAQITTLEEGAQAGELYAVQQALIGTEQENLLPTIQALIGRKFELIQAQEDAAESARDEADAYRQLESDYQLFLRMLEQGERANQREADRAANSVAALEKRLELQRLQLTLSEEEFEIRRNLSQLADGVSDEDVERIRSLTVELQKLRADQGESFLGTIGEELSNIGARASDVAASVALGFTDADDAARTLVQTVGTQLLGAIIEWGVQTVIQAATATTAVTTATATQTGAIVGATATQTAAATTAQGTLASVSAGAAATTATAWAPAAAAVNTATAGGAAATGVPITLAAIAAITGAILGFAVGGRSQGGPVSAGSMYRVNEFDQEFFIPSTDGVIATRNQLSGGGGNGGGGTFQPIINNVFNLSGSGAGEFQRPRGRRQLEAATFEATSMAFRRNN